MEPQAARTKINWLHDNKNKTITIHYACGNLYDSASPVRITHISCTKMQSGQNKGFSFIDYKERYPLFSEDQIEKRLLEDFFVYVNNNKGKHWIHWNMRDSNYGFVALENRCTILGGSPHHFDESRLIDLADLLKSIYGHGYAKNPRMYNVARINKITPKNFLQGAEEAKFFTLGKLREIGLSCNSKTSLFGEIIELAYKNILVVENESPPFFRKIWRWLIAGVVFVAFMIGLINDSFGIWSLAKSYFGK